MRNRSRTVASPPAGGAKITHGYQEEASEERTNVFHFIPWLQFGGTLMNVRKWLILGLLAGLSVAIHPETSEAQFFGRGRGIGVGVGSGYGGYGYGGNGYGSGWGYPGYYNNGRGSGIGVSFGNRYSYPGYNNGYYSNGFYNNSYYTSTPGVSYNQSFVNGSQPIVNGGSTSYQSFYPTMSNGAVGQSNDPCCCGGGPGQTQMAGVNQGSGTLVVNVPENAQLFWNGMTPMVGNGASRRFTMQADGTTQRIEARWTGADGKTMTQTREVTARPNDTVTVDFTNGSNGTNDGRANETTPNNNNNSTSSSNGINNGINSGTGNSTNNGTNNKQQ